MNRFQATVISNQIPYKFQTSDKSVIEATYAGGNHPPVGTSGEIAQQVGSGQFKFTWPGGNADFVISVK